MDTGGHLYLDIERIYMDNLGTGPPIFNSRNHLHIMQTVIFENLPDLSLGKMKFFPSITVTVTPKFLK